MSLPPQGWYPDPAGSPQERFWDGQTWTYYLRPAQIASYASWGWRAVAGIIDYLIINILSYLLNGFVTLPQDRVFEGINEKIFDAASRGEIYLPWSYPGFFEAYAFEVGISILIITIYHTIFLACWGRSIGAICVGLRVVPLKDENATKLSLGTAALRSSCFAVFCWVPIFGFINFFSPLWLKKHRAYHDLVAKTAVLKIG